VRFIKRKERSLEYDDNALIEIRNFLKKLNDEVCSEHESEGHIQISQRMIDHLLGSEHIKKGDKVLHVGCGKGYDLETLANLGCIPVGVTSDHKDFQVCRNKDFNVYEMDQSFL
jgi:protein-L-isoaspartate O-methyltransferase